MAFVLVVDDDQTVRSIVGRILSIKGYSVGEVCGGGEALEAIEAQAPDLVLSDVDMPGMDGFALLSEARARGFQNAFIGMSGRDVDGDRFDAFLAKPFRMERMLEVVEDVLSERAAVPER